MIPTKSADGSNTCVQSPKVSQLKLAQEHGVGGDEEHNIIKEGWCKNVGYPIYEYGAPKEGRYPGSSTNYPNNLFAGMNASFGFWGNKDFTGF